jgi:hypothetical protein
MRVQITGARLKQLVGGWPRRCCGCGAPPTTTYEALVRTTDMSILARVLGVLGHGVRWTTHSLRLPACGSCQGRSGLAMTLWVIGCVIVGLVCLANLKLAAPFDAEGNRVEGARRALGLAVGLGFGVSVFLGAPLAFVIQRRFAPAVLHALDGPSFAEAREIDVTFRDEQFAREAQDLASSGGGPHDG